MTWLPIYRVYCPVCEEFAPVLIWISSFAYMCPACVCDALEKKQ